MPLRLGVRQQNGIRNVSVDYELEIRFTISFNFEKPIATARFLWNNRKQREIWRRNVTGMGYTVT